MNAIELSVFASRMASVCDEMGAVLKCAAFSPNIKDRLDFSCALFDAGGQLSAQAAHIPVHLGSRPTPWPTLSVSASGARVTCWW